MKWLSGKVAYPLVVLALIAGIGLQAVWLFQLFQDRLADTKEKIERCVSDAAKSTIYRSLEKTSGNTLRSFFLAPEWMEFNKAFEGLHVPGLVKQYEYRVTDDSTNVSINFSFRNQLPVNPVYKSSYSTSDQSAAEEEKLNRISLKMMNQKTINILKANNIDLVSDFVVYTYIRDSLITTEASSKIKQAAFASKKYSYNLRHRYRYQLIVPALNAFVVYQMRYYLLSSFLMLLLTAAAFYFILMLMRQQRLYANARLAFIGNMTHEFKTPLATIAVALESITKYDLTRQPDKMISYLDISNQELKRLDGMVEKILNLNQEGIGDQQLNFELFDVQAGLQDVFQSMQLRAENTKTHIGLKLSEEPCFVMGDPLHLQNVFFNLIDNAIKYTGPNVELEISCRKQDRIYISFSDKGPGIDAIYRNKIFERFFRIPEQGDTHNVKGFGLGLNYVKQIVEKHGGTITLETEKGAGSNFIIILNVADEV